MKSKERAMAILAMLPPDCCLEDVIYHLYVVQAIERGQADSAAGRTVAHEEVEAKLREKWLRTNDE
ncbi:MAG: hypothetical protein IT365_04970 [Candidatus Hydrogenedentes bacterium]|nr:hypothetical protein [Candidatus Hydrogenedentota bacterium]